MNKLVTYVMAILSLCATGFLVFWFLIQEPFAQKMEEIDTRIRDAKEQIRKYERAKEQCKTYEEKINSTKKKIFRLLCSAKGRTIEDFLILIRNIPIRPLPFRFHQNPASCPGFPIDSHGNLKLFMDRIP